MDQAVIEGDRFAAMREAMVTSQLRTTAVSDNRVVAAMARVPREEFVPAVRRDTAYTDRAVPLARGRMLNTPMATGKRRTEAYLRPSDGVLLIGAATGYAAAVLASLVAEVIAVEVDHELVDQARAALSGTPGVAIVEGPLPKGHAEGASYDVIVIDGAIEDVPQTLIDQLAIAGRLVTGLDDKGVTRLASGVRSARGFGLQHFADAECVLLPGFSRARTFRF